MRSALAILMGALFLCSAAVSRGDQVVVFAAASLSEALTDIGQAYEREARVKLVFNFGASSLLARQIEEGAPADLFFSADEAKMDHLEKKGLVEPGTRKRLLSNSLVVVVVTDRGPAIAAVEDLAKPEVKKVALAEPQTVPAGIYARSCLERLKVWPAVEPKVVPAENVRGALAAVEAGNVDAAMVYKTDAAISRKVRVACEVPAGVSPTIAYPAAVVKGSRQMEAARTFLKHLESEAASRVFRKYGFVVLD